MRIYFGHSRKSFDCEKEYYLPILQNSKLQNETLLFPHRNNQSTNQTRDFYSTLDLFIAEVSYAATGLGIELGWAKDDNVPIYCFYKKGTTPASSLKYITSNIIEYDSLEQLSLYVEKIVNEFNNKSLKK